MLDATIEAAPEFPALDPGLTLLKTDDRAAEALHSLVLDHLLLNETEAVWVDARNNATTQPLAKLAPSMQLLDRVNVARAFTAFQHFGIIDDLPPAISDDVSLLVLPAIDWFYAGDDLHSGEGEKMLTAILERVQCLAEQRELPVLITRHEQTGVSCHVTEYTDAQLECTLTQFGPRFTGTDFETLLFECPGGVQTTLAFWRRILQHRHESSLETPMEGIAVGSD